MRGPTERVVLPVATLALLLGAWALAVHLSGTKIFPAPREVARGLAELAGKQLLWADIEDSLRRVLEGFGAAALVGLPLGFAMGSSPLLFALVNPLLQILRPISPI